MKKNQKYSDVLEIIFENKNKAYGAYYLRRTNRERTLRALFIVFSLVFGLGLMSFMGSGKVKEDKKQVVVIDLDNKYRVEVNKVEPVNLPKADLPKAPPVASIIYVPPVLKADSEVPEEQPVSDTKELTNKVISNVKSEGTPTGNPEIPVSPISTGGENTNVIPKPEPKVDVYDGFAVNQVPLFPGGDAKLMEYLSKNIKYPDLAREAGVEGTVTISFIIDEQGKVTNIKALKPLGYGMEKEAIRVISEMPLWSSGKMNGISVKVKMTLPVRFRLNH